MSKKRLLIKLGSQCNWSCQHCHNQEVNYPYNEKLIDYIKANDYRRITFSGGEPLLYWNTIVKICEALGKDYQYKLVTNGSLLDRSKIAFLSKYKFQTILSFDGSDGKRSGSPQPQYRMFSYLRDTSFSVCVYKQNMNLPKIQQELLDVCREYKIRPKASLQPEFIHQTEVVDDGTDIETAKEYCRQMAKIIEPEIVSVVSVAPEKRFGRFMQYHTLKKALAKWLVPKTTCRGLRCFNEEYQSVSLDGRFLLCPYSDKRVVGDVEKGVDWEAVESHVPAACRKCDLFTICGCACVANVTNHECYIAKTMNKWLEKVAAKYDCKDMLIELWRKQNDCALSSPAV